MGDTLADEIGAYLRQLPPHVMEREAAQLLKKAHSELSARSREFVDIAALFKKATGYTVEEYKQMVAEVKNG